MKLSKSVKDFFKSIEDSDELLLFLRLYRDPESVLGSSRDMDKAEKEYYKLFDYFRLMMNNNLTEFVNAVHNDLAFSIKANNNPQILRKLKFFVYDSIDFKKYYHLCDDKNLVAVLNDKMPVKEYLRMEGSLSFCELFEFYNIYKKYKRLYKHGYSSSVVDTYDETKAQYAKRYLTDAIEVVKERQKSEKELDELKQNVFSQIEQEDCTETATFETFLRSNPILEPDDYYENMYFYTNQAWILLCQNRFLRVIEKKLNNAQLGGFPLDNAINIITMGIDIKVRNHPEAVWYRREVLDPSVVDEFDLEYAKELCTKLIIYRANISKGLKKANYLDIVR